MDPGVASHLYGKAPLAEEDATLTRAEPHRFDVVWVGSDDRLLTLGYLRGNWQALHHVDIESRHDDVLVTVFLGWRPEAAEAARKGWGARRVHAGGPCGTNDCPLRRAHRRPPDRGRRPFVTAATGPSVEPD